MSDMKKLASIDMSISGLHAHYVKGDFSPRELIKHVLSCSQVSCVHSVEYDESTGNPIWLSLFTEDDLAPLLARLDNTDPAALPLYGIPFAVKDNIDVEGLSTTAACPAFAYEPESHASVVALLIAAGAIPLGKTNLDQFATGLVGTRSPYGVCRNALNADYISGGSSSGSAVAVALGLVSFALGTDTAGSGRVPAALNNIVGLKPTKGLLSTKGVVPACRTLDCVSIFALNVDDANAVFNVAAQPDEQDAYGRDNDFSNASRYYQSTPLSAELTVGIPKAEQLNFFGNAETQAAFAATLEMLRAQGVIINEVDFEPFLESALLLYQGPWVAERYSATKNMVEQHPEDMHPVVREIIQGGNTASAVDCFEAQYQLQAYKKQADALLAQVDVMLIPTIGTVFTTEEVLDNPIALNSQLGYYTNFMNLLDFAAIALPTEILSGGVGFGVTLFHQARTDKWLMSLAAEMQNVFNLDSGCGHPFKPQGQVASKLPYRTIDVAVCGAHLQGLPLNWQLTERGATLIESTSSSEHYRLYALAGGPIARPGMARVAAGGAGIPIEIWRLPATEFGSFVNEIPAPLGIGKIEKADGTWVSGFICEPYGLSDAEDITHYGGWRAYMAAR